MINDDSTKSGSTLQQDDVMDKPGDENSQLNETEQPMKRPEEEDKGSLHTSNGDGGRASQGPMSGVSNIADPAVKRVQDLFADARERLKKMDEEEKRAECPVLAELVNNGVSADVAFVVLQEMAEEAGESPVDGDKEPSTGDDESIDKSRSKDRHDTGANMLSSSQDEKHSRAP